MLCGKSFAFAAALLVTGVLSAADERTGGEFAQIEALADESSARAAVRKVTSGCVLAQIGRNSKSWRLRADAVYFLADESIRREIFEKDADWRVKAAALFREQVGAFLTRIACDESVKDELRAVAISKLRDRTVLEKLKTSSNAIVRKFAVAQLPPEFKEAKVVPIPETTFTDVKAVTRLQK